MPAKTYTKKEISKQVSERIGSSHAKAHRFTDALFEVMSELIREDNEKTRIEVRNFGVLTVKPAKAKPNARNPKTGEIFYVPAHRKIHFMASALIKKVLKRPL